MTDTDSRPIAPAPLRILFLTAMFGRPVLTRLILRHYNALCARVSRSVGPVGMIVVGSEGEASRALCADLPLLRYVEAPNDPLNRKYNAGLAVAKAMNPDAVVIVGSDDMISDNLVMAYADRLAAGEDFVGLRDLYFFDAVTQRLGYWPGYGGDDQPHRTGEPIGCGRCHSRRLLDAVDWKLWPDDPARNTVMDRHSLTYLTGKGFTPTSFALADVGAKAVDVKVGANITDFDRIRYLEVTIGGRSRDYLGDLFDPIGIAQLTHHWTDAAAPR